VFEDGARTYREKFIGKNVSVLWESATELTDDGWQMEGLTGNYLRVKAVLPEPRWNEIDVVRLED
jgi:hypothetical protein